MADYYPYGKPFVPWTEQEPMKQGESRTTTAVELVGINGTISHAHIFLMHWSSFLDYTSKEEIEQHIKNVTRSNEYVKMIVFKYPTLWTYINNVSQLKLYYNYCNNPHTKRLIEKKMFGL